MYDIRTETQYFYKSRTKKKRNKFGKNREKSTKKMSVFSFKKKPPP